MAPANPSADHLLVAHTDPGLITISVFSSSTPIELKIFLTTASDPDPGGNRIERRQSSGWMPKARKSDKFLSTSWRCGSRVTRRWNRNDATLWRNPTRNGIPAKYNIKALRNDLCGVSATVNDIFFKVMALRHIPDNPRSLLFLSSTMISSMSG